MSVDFNVKNYSVDELFNLLGLTGSATKDDVEEETRKQIKKFSQAMKSNYVNFYIEIREKLLNHLEGKEIQPPQKPKWDAANYRMDYNGDMWEYPQNRDGAILSQEGNERITPARVLQMESGRVVYESAPRKIEEQEVVSFVPGVLNPRKVSTYKVLIDIDSRAIADEGLAVTSSCPGGEVASTGLQRKLDVGIGTDGGSNLKETPSNFMFQADTKISKAISLELLYYDIPYTWHEFTPSYGTDLFRVIWDKVTEKNNRFKVAWWNFEKNDSKISYNAADVSGEITLPQGNYTLDDFLTEMNKAGHDILFEKYTVGVSGKNGFVEDWKDQNDELVPANRIKISRTKRHGIFIETTNMAIGGAPKSGTIYAGISGEIVDWKAMDSDLDASGVPIDIDLSGGKLRFKQNAGAIEFSFTFDRPDTIEALGLDISGSNYGDVSNNKIIFEASEDWIETTNDMSANRLSPYYDVTTNITFSDDDVALSMGFEEDEISLNPSSVGKYTIITDVNGYMAKNELAFDVADVDQPVIIKEGVHEPWNRDSFVYDPSKINIDFDDGLVVKKRIEHIFNVGSSSVNIREISNIAINNDRILIRTQAFNGKTYGGINLSRTNNKLKFSNTDASFNLTFEYEETAEIMGFDLSQQSVEVGGEHVIESNILSGMLQFDFNIIRAIDFRHVTTANMLGFNNKNESDGIAERSYINESAILYIPEYSIEIEGGNKTKEEFLAEINAELAAKPIKNYLVMDTSGQQIRMGVKNISDISTAHNFEITFDSSMNTDILEFDTNHLSGDNSYTAIRDVSSTLIPWERKTYIGNVRYEEVKIPSGNYNLKRGDDNYLIDVLRENATKVEITKNRQGTITISDPSAAPFKLIFYNEFSDDTKCGKSGAKSDYNLGKILGFNENEYVNVSYSYTSEKQCSTRETTKFLYLSINDFNNSRRSITRVTHQTIKEKMKLPDYAAKECELNDEIWVHRRRGGALKAVEEYVVAATQDSQITSSQNRYFNATPPEDVFARIPIRGADPTESPAPNLTYDGGDRFVEKRQYFGPVDIKRLKVEIFNDKGEIIDLQGGSVFLQLRAECLYQS
tara:strand:+ start:3374 stop:6619 length:3246 start_codon:yes stop_codon:yes gene_type:complete